VPLQQIESPQNPRIKAAARLRQRRARRQYGRTIVDGAREVARALESTHEVLEIFTLPGFERADRMAPIREALATRHDIALFETQRRAFEKLAFGERDEGIAAVVATPECPLEELEIGDSPLVAVVEGVEKPGNLGAVLRTADAVGLSALIVCGSAVDVYSPNVIRASLGAVFSIPIAVAESSAAANWLYERGVPVFAARPDADLLYHQADLGSAAAIVLGSEAQGLSPAWSEPRATGIRLPMCGRVDSLNVSVAAGVILYEALRQRGCEGPSADPAAAK